MLYAIDAQNGDLIRAFQTGGTIEASPAVVDGTVYVASWDHKLYAFSIS
jgi:outer membrane protein assembly factor BamB